jgi:hypothetical protein
LSTLEAGGAKGVDSEPTSEAAEEFETSNRGGNFADDTDHFRRLRRQVDEAAVRRNIHKQNQAMKEAVQLSKNAGTSIDYSGSLSRSTVVSSFYFFYEINNQIITKEL